jgi:hypothetical protein
LAPPPGYAEMGNEPSNLLAIRLGRGGNVPSDRTSRCRPRRVDVKGCGDRRSRGSATRHRGEEPTVPEQSHRLEVLERRTGSLASRLVSDASTGRGNTVAMCEGSAAMVQCGLLQPPPAHSVDRAVDLAGMGHHELRAPAGWAVREGTPDRCSSVGAVSSGGRYRPAGQRAWRSSCRTTRPKPPGLPVIARSAAPHATGTRSRSESLMMGVGAVAMRPSASTSTDSTPASVAAQLDEVGASSSGTAVGV